MLMGEHVHGIVVADYFLEKYAKGRFFKSMILALYLLMLGHLRHGACLDRHCDPNSVAICAWCSCPEGASLIKASFLGRRRFNCPLGAGPHFFLLAICFSQKRCSLITFFGLCPSYCIAVVRPMSIFFSCFKVIF